MKDFTKEEAEYFAHVGTESDSSPLTEEQEDDLWEMRQQVQTHSREQGFDVTAHARTKFAGSVGYTDTMARGREKALKACPLIQQVRQNSVDAERRLRNSKGKTFPEEARPEDQYKHLDLSMTQIREGLDEFLIQVSRDFSSKEAEKLTRESVLSEGKASEDFVVLRSAIRACVYAFITHSRTKQAKMFGASSLRTFSDAFADWFYNYQHYTQGEFHMYFTELKEKFLEKSLREHK